MAITKNKIQIIPFRNIAESLELYKQVHAPTPEFGMDLYSPDFVPSRIVLLSNNGDENKGIPIRCDHFILVLGIAGEGLRRINHHRFRITPRSAHLILPGQIHSFSNTSNDFKIYILLFERSFLTQSNITPLALDRLLHVDLECNPKMNLTSVEFSTWKNTFQLIHGELSQRKEYYEEVVATHIFSLLLLIKRKLFHNHLRDKGHSRQQEIYLTFKQLIEQHFQEKKTVNEYAQLMHISPKHLSETVKRRSNHTALYHIQERIVHEAEYLLVYSNQSVKEISNALFFPTPSLFGRFFKKQKGVSPLSFRDSNR